MKKFIEVVKEINYNFNLVLLFETVLNSIIIFLFFYACFLLLSVNPSVAFYPTGTYLLIATYHKIKKKHIKDIEDIDYELNEKLRTAVDNVDVENPVVNELHYEVMKELKNVGVSSFMNQKAISYKVLASVLLSFIVLLLAITGFAFNFDFSTKNPINYIYRPFPGNNSGTSGGGPLRTAGGDTSQDIFDDEDIAKLGEDRFYVALAKTSYELNLQNVREPMRRQFRELFPTETFGQAAETFEENIPKEQQEIVKNYFEKIAKR
jgi:hypothetical protein